MKETDKTHNFSTPFKILTVFINPPTGPYRGGAKRARTAAEHRTVECATAAVVARPSTTVTSTRSPLPTGEPDQSRPFLSRDQSQTRLPATVFTNTKKDLSYSRTIDFTQKCDIILWFHCDKCNVIYYGPATTLLVRFYTANFENFEIFFYAIRLLIFTL